MFRVDPVIGDRLSRAVLYLRTTGHPRTTRKDIAGAALTRWLDDLAGALLAGEDFPAGGAQPSLFADDEETRPPILRPGELSGTPRVTLPREMTRIDGEQLERARRAVDLLRQREDPNLTLYAFISTAVTRLVDEVENRYGSPADGAI